MNLYKVSVDDNPRGSYGNKASIYVVEDTKEKAKSRVESTLKHGFIIKTVSYLGKDITFGRTMFTSEIKRK